MDNLLYTVMTPVIELSAIIAFLGVMFVATHFLATRTKVGRIIMSWIDYAEDEKDAIEDQYTNFQIHRNNFIPGPR